MVTHTGPDTPAYPSDLMKVVSPQLKVLYLASFVGHMSHVISWLHISISYVLFYMQNPLGGSFLFVSEFSIRSNRVCLELRPT